MLFISHLVLSKNPENKNPEKNPEKKIRKIKIRKKNPESKNPEKFIRNLFIIEDTTSGKRVKMWETIW